MALRDQPYLPLYIQDIMTDEELNECSASTHGIYIKGIMCLMHKSKTYGKILLKQNYKLTKDISLNFAHQLTRHTPYSINEIKIAIDELLKENVCYLDGDYLCQKRMIKDNEISIKRSKAGKKGGGNPNFVKTKKQTSSEYENENEYEDKNIKGDYKGEIKTKFFELELEVFDNFRKKYPGTKRGRDVEFNNFRKKHKDWRAVLPILEKKLDEQILIRKTRKERNIFIEDWKHLQTWINQRFWEAELQKVDSVQITGNQVKDILQGNFEKPVTDYFLELFQTKNVIKSVSHCEYLAGDLSKKSGRDLSVAVAILKGTAKTSSI